MYLTRVKKVATGVYNFMVKHVSDLLILGHFILHKYLINSKKLK